MSANQWGDGTPEPTLLDVLKGRIDHYAYDSLSEMVVRWDEKDRLERSGLIIQAINAIDQGLAKVSLEAELDSPITVSCGALIVLYLTAIRRLS